MDLLFYDEDSNRRYEIEVMLGATDPSHIIRTIEYWDIERRRYPGYEHVAVLIAEDITSRFLNVLSLMSGSIPFIAIQLCALRVGNSIVLNFVRVLDQTELRIDDTVEETGGAQVDSSVWQTRTGAKGMKLCEDILGLINNIASSRWELNPMDHYIGLKSYGKVDNFVWLAPRKNAVVHVGFRTSIAPELHTRFETAGLPTRLEGQRRCHVTLTPESFVTHGKLIEDAVRDTATDNDYA